MNDYPLCASGAVLELRQPQGASRVSETSLVLMQLATLMGSLGLLGSTSGITALAPLIGMFIRWALLRFWHLPSTVKQALACLCFALPLHLLFVLTAWGGYARDPMGLLGLAEPALLAIFQLQFLRLTTFRMSLLAGLNLVVLLFHMSLSQDVIRSAWVMLTFLVIWTSLASRHASHIINTRWLSDLRWGVRYAAWTLVIAAPLMLLFFVLFPRLPLDALKNQAIDRGGQGGTGLSNSMSIGSISELQKSFTPAFDATFQSVIPESTQLYWRSIILDRFDGKTWTSTTPASGAHATAHLVKPIGETVRYTINWDIETQSKWVVTLDGSFGYADVSFDRHSVTVPMREDGSFSVSAADSSTGAGDGYNPKRIHTTGARAAFKWRLGDSKEQEGLDDELELPVGFNPKAIALGKTLRERLRDDERIVDALLSRFRTEDYHYTLKPPRVGRNSIDDFLFETRAGFCEYYASSFVVVMRAAGIPARVVTGYLSKAPEGNTAKVLQSDAHAWAEVWLGDRGWVRQDPTAAIDPSRIDPDAAGSRMNIKPNGLFDYLHVRSKRLVGMVDLAWRDHMTSFDQGSQARLFEKIGVDKASKTILVISSLVAFMAAGILWQRASSVRSILISILRHRSPMQDLTSRLQAAGVDIAPGQSWRSRLETSRARLDAHSISELQAIVEMHELLSYSPEAPAADMARSLQSRIRNFKPSPIPAA